MRITQTYADDSSIYSCDNRHKYPPQTSRLSVKKFHLLSRLNFVRHYIRMRSFNFSSIDKLKCHCITQHVQAHLLLCYHFAVSCLCWPRIRWLCPAIGRSVSNQIFWPWFFNQIFSRLNPHGSNGNQNSLLLSLTNGKYILAILSSIYLR